MIALKYFALGVFRRILSAVPCATNALSKSPKAFSHHCRSVQQYGAPITLRKGCVWVYANQTGGGKARRSVPVPLQGLGDTILINSLRPQAMQLQANESHCSRDIQQQLEDGRHVQPDLGKNISHSQDSSALIVSSFTRRRAQKARFKWLLFWPRSATARPSGSPAGSSRLVS